MNDEEIKQSLLKQVADYRHLRNWLLVFCVVLAMLCSYTIIQWQQEKVVGVTIERLYDLSEQTKDHYQQQWVDTLIERNEYQDLYEDCLNGEPSLPWEGYSDK